MSGNGLPIRFGVFEIDVHTGELRKQAAGFRRPQWECGSHSDRQRKAGDKVGTYAI